MEDLSTRFADFLEGTALKVRSMTVDRALRYTKWASLGLVAAILALTALVFLAVGIFRLVALWLGVDGAYLVFGGLFLLAGALLWARRSPKDRPHE